MSDLNYATPADVGISDNRQDHIDRGSPEPGTDYMTAYGTNLRAPFDGWVSEISRSNSGAAGRRIQFTNHANGETVDYIHLAEIASFVNVGDDVKRGEMGLCRSGCSGFVVKVFTEP